MILLFNNYSDTGTRDALKSAARRNLINSRLRNRNRDELADPFQLGRPRKYARHFHKLSKKRGKHQERAERSQNLHTLRMRNELLAPKANTNARFPFA